MPSRLPAQSANVRWWHHRSRPAWRTTSTRTRLVIALTTASAWPRDQSAAYSRSWCASALRSNRNGQLSGWRLAARQAETAPQLVRGHELPHVLAPRHSTVVLLESFEQARVGGQHALDLLVDRVALRVGRHGGFGAERSQSGHGGVPVCGDRGAPHDLAGVHPVQDPCQCVGSLPVAAQTGQDDAAIGAQLDRRCWVVAPPLAGATERPLGAVEVAQGSPAPIVCAAAPRRTASSCRASADCRSPLWSWNVAREFIDLATT